MVVWYLGLLIVHDRSMNFIEVCMCGVRSRVAIPESVGTGFALWATEVGLSSKQSLSLWYILALHGRNTRVRLAKRVTTSLDTPRLPGTLCQVVDNLESAINDTGTAACCLLHGGIASTCTDKPCTPGVLHACFTP